MSRYSALIAAVLFVGGWEAAIDILEIPRYIIPAPSEILQSLIERREALWGHFQLTAIVTLAGFAIGTALSISLALLIVYWKPAKRLFLPYMTLIQTTPKIALLPVFIIWLGFGLKTNILYTALICFFPVLVNFVQGLEDIDRNEVRLMTSYNASTWQVFRHVSLYRALPYLFAGLKLTGVLALIGAVVAEFVAGNGGVGYFMLQSQALLRTPQAFAALVVLSATGLTIYTIIDIIHRKAVPWADEVAGTDVV